MNTPRLRLVTENRMAVAETQLSDHEARLQALEGHMQSLAQAQVDTLQTSQATHRLVLKLVPEVTELKKQSRAMKVAKRTGGAGLLLALGGILESYGPDIIRLILGR
jgi:hypothetical protein